VYGVIWSPATGYFGIFGIAVSFYGMRCGFGVILEMTIFGDFSRPFLTRWWFGAFFSQPLSFNQPTNQPINRSINQSIKEMQSLYLINIQFVFSFVLLSCWFLPWHGMTWYGMTF
jgi:hypothetical protein